MKHIIAAANVRSADSGHRRGRRLRAIGALAAACTVLAGASAAWAITQQTQGPIHACVSRGILGLGKGTVRIVAPGTKCGFNEDPLSWNHQVQPVVRTVTTTTSVTGLFADTLLSCDAGEAAINATLSGGTGGIDVGASIAASVPLDVQPPSPPTRWYVRVVPHGGPVEVILTLFCMKTA